MFGCRKQKIILYLLEINLITLTRLKSDRNVSHLFSCCNSFADERNNLADLVHWSILINSKNINYGAKQNIYYVDNSGPF